MPPAHPRTLPNTCPILAAPWPCALPRPQAEHPAPWKSDPAFFFPTPTWLQYSYEGMEINNLPVELTVVWNGHFNIDNPAQNKGVEGGPRGKGGVEGRSSSCSQAGGICPPPW